MHRLSMHAFVTMALQPTSTEAVYVNQCRQAFLDLSDIIQVKCRSAIFFSREVDDIVFDLYSTSLSLIYKLEKENFNVQFIMITAIKNRADILAYVLILSFSI